MAKFDFSRIYLNTENYSYFKIILAQIILRDNLKLLSGGQCLCKMGLIP